MLAINYNAQSYSTTLLYFKNHGGLHFFTKKSQYFHGGLAGPIVPSV